jgi:uncharacterized protein YlbG (UPF0298 family)
MRHLACLLRCESLSIHCKQPAFYARLKIEKEMDTRGNVMLAQRQSIIVWLHSIKQAKMLRKFGNVHYVSKRLKYVVLYCNQDEIEELMEKIKSYSFVKKVEPSYKPFVKIEFENSKPDKAKEYDYKMGI